MTSNLVKVGASDCPICEEMSQFDGKVADRLGLVLVYIELNNVSDWPALKEYLIQNHVDNQGMIDIPVYIVHDGNGFKNSIAGQYDESSLEILLSD